MTGSNTFSGGVLISDGTLLIDSEQALGNATSLEFTGVSSILSVANDSTFPSTLGVSTYSSSPSHMTIDVAASKTATFNGPFADGTSSTSYLFKDGRGALVLNGNNTFSGYVNIANGTLSVSSLSALGSSNQIKFEEKSGETALDVGLLNIKEDVSFPSGFSLSVYGSSPESIEVDVDDGKFVDFAGVIQDGSFSTSSFLREERLGRVFFV